MLLLKTPRSKPTKSREALASPRAKQSVAKQPMALVLAGGNALGGFEAGAYQVLHDQGLMPSWIVGTSIGAVNGAIIAGNHPEQRIDALREFWSGAAWPTPGGGFASNGLSQALQRL